MLSGTYFPALSESVFVSHSPVSLDSLLLIICPKKECEKAVKGHNAGAVFWVFCLLGWKHPGCRECIQLIDGHHGENAPPDRGYQCGISSSLLMAIALMALHNSVAIITNIC